MHLLTMFCKPGAVARSDVRPLGIWTVAGSTPMSDSIRHEILSTAILSLPLIRLLSKDLVNRSQEKRIVRLTHCLVMTIVVD